MKNPQPKIRHNVTHTSRIWKKYLRQTVLFTIVLCILCNCMKFPEGKNLGIFAIVNGESLTDSTPSNLIYSGSPYTFTNGSPILPKTPTVTGTITSCTSSPPMPTGLRINSSTCEISGTPTVNQGITSYTITASNAYGSTTAGIDITVIPTVGNKIAFIQTDTISPNLYQIRTMNTDGSGLNTIYSSNTAGVNITNIRWSPDRTRIVMFGTNGANIEIRLINSDGAGNFLVYSIATASACAAGYGTSVNWWDNSTLIHNLATSPACHIYKINTDGTGNSIFINYAGFSGNAVFSSERSPDGTKVLLMNWGSGNTMHYLYTVNQDGSSGITSLGVTSYNSDPRYSPDQTKISYNYYTGTWEQRYCNANGTAQTTVTAYFSGVHTWYDNNSWIYFDTATKELRRRNLDGTGITTIITLGGTQSAGDIHY